MNYINESEKFWRHSYQIHLSEFDLTGVCVNADNESDALDFAIDYHESLCHMGLFIDNPTKEDFNNQLIGGNHSLVLSSDNIIITKLD